MSLVRRLPLLAIVAALLAPAAGTAHAGALVGSASSCDDAVLEQPFLPWLDPARYVHAPDGGFEAGAAGWSLTDASSVAGNEPWNVHAAGDSRSLSIGAGGSATSPVMCVGVEHPTLRLFAKRAGGSEASRLAVEVLFEGADGASLSAPLGAIAGDGSWSPTAAMPILVNLLPLLPGERTPVAFRFTASDGAAWRIDDVYVDPYCRC